MYTPQYLFLDIETIPSGDPPVVQLTPRPELEDVKVGNRKGETAEIYRKATLPSYIDKWQEDCEKQIAKANEEFLKRGVHSLTSEIVCIGYAFDNNPPEIISGDEKEIIQNFNALLNRFGDKKYAVQLVGHNIIEFDLKLIYHRSIKYSQISLMRFLSGFSDYQGKTKLMDTMKMWSLLSYREYTKLDDIARYLQVGSKKDVDGSMVYKLFSEGKIQEIYDYCKDDVDLVRKVFFAMVPQKLTGEEVA